MNEHNTAVEREWEWGTSNAVGTAV